MEPQTPIVSTSNPNPPSPTPQTSATPESWPGAFGLVKYARQATFVNLWPILGVALIGIVISMIFGSFDSHRSYGPGNSINFLVDILLITVMTQIYLASARQTKITIADAFRRSFPLYVKAAGLNILTSIIAVLSLVLFIVPFFIIMPRLSLANYFLVDKNMGPVESLKASWAVTQGNVGKVWGIFGVAILMAMAAIVLIGIYFLFIYSTAFALLYVYLTRQQATATPTAPAPASAPIATVPPATVG